MTARWTWEFVAKYYQEISNLYQICVTIKNTAPQRWKIPSTGTMKINFDWSLNSKSMKGGIGVIAKDATVTLLGFYQTIIDGSRDP